MAESPNLTDPAWITPKQALEIVALTQGASAGAVLMEHIKGAILPVLCARRSIADGGDEPEVKDEPAPIPAAWWRTLQEENTFWNAATARFYFRDIDGERHIRCFGIVMMRVQVERLFPPPVLTPAQAYAAQAELSPLKRVSLPVTSPEPEQKGPRVSDPLLAAWFALYSKAYPVAEDTEDRAVESARGMFPGKAVSRQRVRDLRGGKKRGPKPKTAE